MHDIHRWKESQICWQLLFYFVKLWGWAADDLVWVVSGLTEHDTEAICDMKLVLAYQNLHNQLISKTQNSEP